MFQEIYNTHNNNSNKVDKKKQPKNISRSLQMNAQSMIVVVVNNIHTP